MPAATLHARESVAFDDVITIQDSAGDAVDITGWTFTAALMRRAGAVDVSLASVSAGSQGFTVVDGPAGALRVRINQATLAGIADTTGNFTLFGDLLGTPPAGEARFVADLRLTVTVAGETFEGRTYTVVLEAIAAAVKAELEELVADASASAATAQALGNFRKTLAAGVSAFAVGAFFSSAEAGELRAYERIADAPGYEDLGDAVAPLTKALMASGLGAGRVGHQLDDMISDAETVANYNNVLARLNMVARFGADPTGVADCEPAISAAHAHVETYYPNGCRLEWPDGDYKIATSPTAITNRAISHDGASRNGTRWKISATHDVLRWEEGAWGGGARNFQMIYDSAPASTACLFRMAPASNKVFENIGVQNIGRFLLAEEAVVGGVPTKPGAVYIKNCGGSGHNIAVPLIEVAGGSGYWLDPLCSFYVEGVPVPAFDRTSTMTTVDGRDFIKISGQCDTLFLSPGVACNRFDRAIHVDAPGNPVNNIWANGAVLDFCKRECVLLNANNAVDGVGGIVDVRVVNTYMCSWSERAVYGTGDNYNEMHLFAHNVVVIAGKDGFKFEGPRARQIYFGANQVMDCNRLVGSYSAVHVGACPGPVQVHGNIGFHSIPNSLSWEPTYGTTTEVGALAYDITLNDTVGDTKNYNINYPWSSNPGVRRVYNNHSEDYSGYIGAPGEAPTGGMEDANFAAPSAGGGVFNYYGPFNLNLWLIGCSALEIDRNNAAPLLSTPAFDGTYEDRSMVPLAPGGAVFVYWPDNPRNATHSKFYPRIVN